MRTDTRQRKHAMAGLRAISGDQQLLGVLTRVLHSDKQALDAVMLEMGWIVAESVILIEREEVAGPDYYFSLSGTASGISNAHEAAGCSSVGWGRCCSTARSSSSA